MKKVLLVLVLLVGFVGPANAIELKPLNPVEMASPTGPYSVMLGDIGIMVGKFCYKHFDVKNDDKGYFYCVSIVGAELSKSLKRITDKNLLEMGE